MTGRAQIGLLARGDVARIAARCFAWPLRLWSLAGGSFQISALLFAGLSVSVIVTLVVWLQVVDHQRMEFEWVSHDRNRALEKGVEDTLDAVQSVVDLLRVDADVERSEFRLFADLLLERHPAIRRLEWVPRVRIGDASDQLPDQLPAQLGESPNGQLIDPAIGALIERVTATGQTVISRRVPMALETGRYGIFVVAPVLPRTSAGDGVSSGTLAGT